MIRLLLLLLLAGCAGPRASMKPLAFADLSAPGPMRTATLLAPDGRERHVAFHDAGEGTPVVLLHGLGEHAGYWSENVPGLLAGGVRVVVPDLLGHGRSDKPRANAYGPGAQAALVRGLLDALEVTDPVVLVGHSMGGQIALRFALAWPDRVKRLLLLAPAGVERFTPGEARWIKAASTTGRFAARDEGALRDHFRKNVFGRWSPAAEHHLAERVRLRGAPGFPAYLYAVVRAIHGMLDEPVADELGALKPPVTVVFGAEDRLIPNPLLHGGAASDVAVEAGARLPDGAGVLVLGDVGHMLQIEASAKVDSLILEAAR